MQLHRRALLGGLALLPAAPALAQPKFTPPPILTVPVTAAEVPKPVSRRGSVLIGGKRIDYLATAQEWPVADRSGRLGATVFSTSYVAEAGGARRPVTFLFNGGPAAPTTGLRKSLGPVGPVNAPAGVATKTGAVFVDNPHSILDASDLVFIDCVGTGYSRVLAGADGHQFWGAQEDAAALGAFIAGWLEANHRTASPLFLGGESYGGLRAVMIASLLAERTPRPVLFDGVILISPLTEFRAWAPADDVQSHLDTLPSFAAVAAFHGRGANVGKSVEAITAEANAFAGGDYARFLAAGAAAPADDLHRIAARYAELTGLPEAFVTQHRAKVGIPDFYNTLLADKGERTGLLDARTHAPRAITDKQQPPYNDPSVDRYNQAFNTDDAWDEHYREMGYASPTSYQGLDMTAWSAWDKTPPKGVTNAPELMGRTLSAHPDMRLFEMGGVYDLTLPYRIAERKYAALDLPAGRLRSKLYPTGHAIHSDPATQPVANQDLREFMAA